MLTEKTMEKLRILAESAKYDVSCSSSGTEVTGTCHLSPFDWQHANDINSLIDTIDKLNK